MRPLFVRLTPFLAVIAIASCRNEITGIGFFPVRFAIQLSDTSGVVVSSGAMTLRTPDGRAVEGTYMLVPQTEYPQTGPLEGTLHGDALDISLGPFDATDSGRWLSGTVRGAVITGDWGYVTIAGRVRQGTFSSHGP